MTTPLLAFVVALGVLSTSVLSGIFGMAGGFILMGLYGLLFPVAGAMALHAVTQMASNGYRCWLLRHHLVRKVFWGYSAGTALCVLVFSQLHLVPDKATLYLLLGGVAFLPFVLPKRLQLTAQTHTGAVTCGVGVTAMHLTAGVSGPLLDIFYVHTTLTRQQVVATKAFTQTLGHITKLAYFSAIVPFAEGAGAVPWWLFLAVIPLAMLGATLGTRLLEKMSDHNFNRWSRWLILAIGVLYLIKGIWLLLH